MCDDDKDIRFVIVQIFLLGLHTKIMTYSFQAVHKLLPLNCFISQAMEIKH